MAIKVAVVTGSNKGIGFAIVKRLLQKFDGVVYLTSRDDSRGKAAVAELNKLGLYPAYHQLDVSDRDSIVEFRDHIKEVQGGIDILINNAGVGNSVEFYPPYEECKKIVEINYFSILKIQELLFPLIRDDGRILNMSSSCGHLSNVRNNHWIETFIRKDFTQEDILLFVNWFLESVKSSSFNYNDLADNGKGGAYRISKVALSAQTFLQQKQLASRNISVNSMHPGIVRTDMTIGAGFLNIDEAAVTPVYLVLKAPQELKGEYIWYDGKIRDWYDYTADYYFKTESLKTFASGE